VRRALKLGMFAFLAGSLLWVLGDAGMFEPGRADRWWQNIQTRLAELDPVWDKALLAELLAACWETVKMAWAGTLLGTLLAVPLALLAARDIAPPWIAWPSRTFLVAVRTVPAILWALLLLALVGLGGPAGILGLAVYTTGFLGKLLYESLEAIDGEVLDAARSTGASRWVVARAFVLPEMGNTVASKVLYAFEYNVRASSILGLVGAGGIGTYLLLYIERYQFDRLATALCVLFALIATVEGASALVRRNFLDDAKRA
jgi:phosphonate transport system permease protein